jgi:alpha-glucosidase
LAYTRRGYFRQTVRCTITPTGLSIDFAKPEGGFKPWWKSIAVTVHGWNGTGVARSKGKSVAVVQDKAAGTSTFVVPPARVASTLFLEGAGA